MRRFWIALLTACMTLAAGSAFGQTLNARRMAMGGVTLGGDGANVAYRAVPRAPGQSSGFTLPIGLASVLAHPPSFDPKDSDFNAFEIANLVENPPWNLELNPPQAPSSDVIVSMGRDRLSIDLGDLRNQLPEQESRIAMIQTSPALGMGFGPWFAGFATVVHDENRLSLNPALRRALIDGEPFEPNTQYAVTDSGLGEVMAAFQTGAAMPLQLRGKDPRAKGGFGLYGGVRLSILRGIAHGDTRNVGTFATSDTLFSSTPVEFDYAGDFRDAGPSGGGWGSGFDLGAVMLANGFELGLGVNHIGSRLTWTGEHKQVVRDTLTGGYVTETIDDHTTFTTQLPLEVTANVSRRFAGILVAADMSSAMGVTQGHLGLERWFRWLALRAGGSLDAQHELQGSTGAGARLGPVGLDVALATHGRSFGGDRGLELGVGVSLYH